MEMMLEPRAEHARTTSYTPNTKSANQNGQVMMNQTDKAALGNFFLIKHAVQLGLHCHLNIKSHNFGARCLVVVLELDGGSQLTVGSFKPAGH